jgi:hypothetical protein
MDDKQFLTTLIRDNHLPEFQICHAAEFNGWGEDERPTGGKSGIPKSLNRIDVLAGFDRLKAVLIVTDNDDAKAWRGLRKSLNRICTLPENSAEVGQIYGKPVAVYLIPSPNEYGDLETFCLPEVHRIWPRAAECVNEFLTNTRANEWTKQASKNKATLRAATVGFYEPDPYKGLGHLFENGYFSTKNTRFAPLVEFLRNFDGLVGI